MIYQHPLAYLLGLEGVALLHAFAGEYDRDFTEARLAEVRALLDSADQLGSGAAIRPIPIVEGYGAWAEAYDLPGNQLTDLEQPIVREILDSLPPGTALDSNTQSSVIKSPRASRSRRLKSLWNLSISVACLVIHPQ